MTAPAEIIKQRTLIFSAEPPGQADRAYELLKGVDDLSVERSPQANALQITYSLLDYSLEGLERALVKEGFRLDESALSQIGKKLIHYSENVEYHNLNTPEHPAKDRQREIFVKVYEHHLHGDHDDTPDELREYK